MGHLVLQMMISVDGMVSGPKGELDWIAGDEKLEQDHLERLERADVVIMGAGIYPETPRFWRETADDENAKAVARNIGRAMTETPKIVYSHEAKTIDWEGDEVRVIKDDEALIEDVQRLKQQTEGTIVCYGGVRFARSLVQNDLVDELHLDICPIILGQGQPLFIDLADRTKLRLLESVVYDSGTTMVHYKVMGTSSTSVS